MVNSVVLVGRIATDPEMRYTQSGTAVTNFRIAVNRPPRRGDDQGAAQQQEADFLDVVTWRGQAEFVGTYLRKGALVSVEGRLQVREWEGQDGQRRRNVEVVAFRVQALESRAERERREASAGPAQYPDSAPSGPAPYQSASPAAPAPAPGPPQSSNGAPPAPAAQPRPREQFRPDDAVGGALPASYARPGGPEEPPPDEGSEEIFDDE
jgi:single-strand DNA-binding protein